MGQDTNISSKNLLNLELTHFQILLMPTIECSSMVSIAFLCPGDPGLNPGGFAARIQINIEFTRIIQAYDRATLIAITVTVSSLVGIHK